MFKLNELSGSLIKQGRFKESIDVFYNELELAVDNHVITWKELSDLSRDFSKILLNPSDYSFVQRLGTQMVNLAIRIPGYVPKATPEEFEANVKASREND